MHKHQEKVILPYKQEQLFSLVLDVEQYPEFLPWCANTKILYHQSEREFFADMEIKFQRFRQKYTSLVAYDETRSFINVSQIRGPFKHLANKWIFHARGEETEVEFSIEIELKSKLLDRALRLFFQTAYVKMLSSFKERAEKLYGI